MRVLIAGAGRAGMSVASHLRAAEHEVTIIDRDDSSARRAFEAFGLVALTGDATDAALLREAEAGRADVVVAMLRRDADNLAVVLLAKQMGATRVMVRMRDPEYRPVYKAAGVSRILSEIDVFIGALATAIEHEGVRHSMILGAGGSVAFELTIPATSKVIERTVSSIAADPDFPPSCVFGALYHTTGEVHSPRGGSVITGGMTVLLVSRREEMGDVVRFFVDKNPHQTMPLAVRHPRCVHRRDIACAARCPRAHSETASDPRAPCGGRSGAAPPHPQAKDHRGLGRRVARRDATRHLDVVHLGSSTIGDERTPANLTSCEADFSSRRPPVSEELYAFVQPERAGGRLGEKAASHAWAKRRPHTPGRKGGVRRAPRNLEAPH